MSAAALLVAAARRLRAAGVDDPARDARLLLAHAMGIGVDQAALIGPDPVPDAAATRFDALVTARATRQPLSQIVGSREFFGRQFRVTADVLDPRPETETLVAAALDTGFGRVLDLGTGSGAILISLLAQGAAATGIGADISAAALAVARDNARRCGIAERAAFVLSDWYDSVSGRFDIIVANPPYIAAAEMVTLAPEVRDWEPRIALTPGADGLAAVRRIVAGAGARLDPGGWLMIETGPTQARDTAGLMRAAGFARLRILPDLDGRDRVTAGQWR